MSPKSFKDYFCEQYQCSPEEYEAQVSCHVLFVQARGLRWLIELLSPNFFADDLRFIARLGETVDLTEAHAEASRFHDVHRSKTSLLRNRLNLRASGKKGVKLAYEVFREAGVTIPPASRRPFLNPADCSNTAPANARPVAG